MKDKFIKMHEMRELERQVNAGEISYSRMIEILCEKAEEYRNRNVWIDINKELQFRELEVRLNTTGNYDEPYHKDSIMAYGKICDHDDGFLCEHRREWLFNFIKEKI